MKPSQLVVFVVLASSQLGDGRQSWNRGHRSGMNLHGAVIKIGIEAGNVTVLTEKDNDEDDAGLEIDHKQLELERSDDDELFDDDVNAEEEEKKFSTRQDPGCVGKCICIELYQPVCGSDGVTYGNLCKLNCVSNCVGGRIKMASLGACSLTGGGGGWRPPQNGGGGGGGWTGGGGGWTGGGSGWAGGGAWASGGGGWRPPNPTPAFPTYPPPQPQIPQKPPQYPRPQQPQGGPGAINCYYCNIYIQSR